MRRSANDDYCPNGWDLPGGELAPGESPGLALVREIFEETGLIINDDWSPLHVLSNLKDSWLVIVYRCTVDAEGEWDSKRFFDVKLSSEHQEYEWVTLPELCVRGDQGTFALTALGEIINLWQGTGYLIR